MHYLRQEIREFYLGFVDHRADDDRILKLVTHHPTLNADWVWRYQRKRIMYLNLVKRTGMSMTEIFNLTNAEYVDLIDDVIAMLPKENKVLDDLEEEMEDSMVMPRKPKKKK